jgi:hypothetical protein
MIGIVGGMLDSPYATPKGTQAQRYGIVAIGTRRTTARSPHQHFRREIYTIYLNEASAYSQTVALSQRRVSSGKPAKSSSAISSPDIWRTLTYPPRGSTMRPGSPKL